MIVSHDKPRLPQDFTEQADGPQSALQLTALSTQKFITTFNQNWLGTTFLDNSQSAFHVMPSAIFDQVGNLTARKQNAYSYQLSLALICSVPVSHSLFALRKRRQLGANAFFNSMMDTVFC